MGRIRIRWYVVVSIGALIAIMTLGVLGSMWTEASQQGRLAKQLSAAGYEGVGRLMSVVREGGTGAISYTTVVTTGACRVQVIQKDGETDFRVISFIDPEGVDTDAMPLNPTAEQLTKAVEAQGKTC